ncbi:DUF1573 domain-containing protein [Bacteriovoracaceae bacterium]|nr:DUF1573 domain-containing protein [Bacteriovoracaceae bacterium]
MHKAFTVSKKFRIKNLSDSLVVISDNSNYCLRANCCDVRLITKEPIRPQKIGHVEIKCLIESEDYFIQTKRILIGNQPQSFTIKGEVSNYYITAIQKRFSTILSDNNLNKLCMNVSFYTEEWTDQGHAFLSVQDEIKDNIYSFGFWPSYGMSGEVSFSDHINYSGKKFYYSHCVPIDYEKKVKILFQLEEIIKRGQLWDAVDYNCVNFVHEVFKESVDIDSHSRAYSTVLLARTPQAMANTILKLNNNSK